MADSTVGEVLLERCASGGKNGQTAAAGQFRRRAQQRRLTDARRTIDDDESTPRPLRIREAALEQSELALPLQEGADPEIGESASATRAPVTPRLWQTGPGEADPRRLPTDEPDEAKSSVGDGQKLGAAATMPDGPAARTLGAWAASPERAAEGGDPTRPE